MPNTIEINETAIADYFYEQCAGTTSGHMSMIPNNPTIFGLVKSMTGRSDRMYAATKTDFAQILVALAKKLDPDVLAGDLCKS